MWVFSFDRDETVSTGCPPGPVPVEWVRHLHLNTDHEVWIHGHQALKAECGGAPGWAELQRQSGMSHTTRTATLDQYRDHPHWSEFDWPRGRFLQILKELVPGAERYIAVDNVNLSFMSAERWEFFFPQDFVEVFMPMFEERP